MTMMNFTNEPFTDFSDPAHAAAMRAALDAVRAQLGRTYPLVIGGQQISSADTLSSFNPARKTELVGSIAAATQQQADQALDAAWAAFESWRKLPASVRAGYLLRAAELMRERKFEFCAWLVFEVSKSWAEADGDVAEAIDFLVFYAQEMLRLDGPQPNNSLPGEQDDFVYIPLGAGVVIPPWNFALAIMVGTAVAPLVAGNTVVLKPSPRAPVIAAKFVELMAEVGLPPGVLNLIAGRDDVLGDFLVDSPKTRFIAFTGSKEVGLRIFERAAKRQPGQKWLKRTVLEMGGKDTQIVDETADLDVAAQAIVAAAFGFQGQKCSACSRVVAVAQIYDELLRKSVEYALTLQVGDPAQPETDMGAVIDERSVEKIRHYLALGMEEGRMVIGGEIDDRDGFFVQPTIFADIAPDARLSQEEIFGPVAAFIKARDFDDALEIANNTEFGLTGGLFSNDPQRLQQAREDFYVGNLYLNRKITGAMVGAHPFGGFNMSGTDSKAGGRDYLLHFLQGKSIAQKL
ncbi:MAG: L-glutamate gamma-semialdehyde dehydrogenase [Roseiflexaceae bacterium]|nr:L-glutamate gamma-semialdehyde dehydrogenase [Roseiflexaceae bacterium]